MRAIARKVSSLIMTKIIKWDFTLPQKSAKIKTLSATDHTNVSEIKTDFNSKKKGLIKQHH